MGPGSFASLDCGGCVGAPRADTRAAAGAVDRSGMKFISGFRSTEPLENVCLTKLDENNQLLFTSVDETDCLLVEPFFNEVSV